MIKKIKVRTNKEFIYSVTEIYEFLKANKVKKDNEKEYSDLICNYLKKEELSWGDLTTFDNDIIKENVQAFGITSPADKGKILKGLQDLAATKRKGENDRSTETKKQKVEQGMNAKHFYVLDEASSDEEEEEEESEENKAAKQKFLDLQKNKEFKDKKNQSKWVAVNSDGTYRFGENLKEASDALRKGLN